MRLHCRRLFIFGVEWRFFDIVRMKGTRKRIVWELMLVWRLARINLIGLMEEWGVAGLGCFDSSKSWISQLRKVVGGVAGHTVIAKGIFEVMVRFSFRIYILWEKFRVEDILLLV